MLGHRKLARLRLGQVHILQAKSLTNETGGNGEQPPPDPGGAPPQSRAADSKRLPYMVELCRTVLRELLWPNAFQRKRNYRTANITEKG